VGGCKKQYRVIKLFDDTDDEDVDNLYVEEVANEIHDHAAADINIRGLSTQQKEIVLQCHMRKHSAPRRVIDEFDRQAAIQLAANLPVVPTPTTAMISSFTSHYRKLQRRGIPVGKTSLQDLEKFAQDHRIGNKNNQTVKTIFTS
jgi:hypothetical protein